MKQTQAYAPLQSAFRHHEEKTRREEKGSPAHALLVRADFSTSVRTYMMDKVFWDIGMGIGRSGRRKVLIGPNEGGWKEKN